jgi:hypothetical protein
MPVTIVEDLIDGAESEINPNGRIEVRAFRVYGLTPGPGIWQQAYDELAGQKGVAYNVPHPNNGAIFVNRIRPKPFPARSKTSVKVYVTYGTPDFGNTPETVLAFNGTTREIETERYADGKLIKVSYTSPDGTVATQLGRSRTTRAYGVLTFRMEVPDDPENKLVYLNKVNSVSFRGQPKWTWKVMNLTIEKIRYRPGYKFCGAIEYDEHTHLHTMLFRDNATYEVPADIEPSFDLLTPSGNGYVNDLLVNTMDLNGLGLPSVI